MLPTEIWEMILEFCPISSLFVLKNACKCSRKLVSRGSLWKHALQVEYPNLDFHTAIKQKRPNLVLALIYSGRTVNCLEDGFCPLSWAIKERQFKIAQLFLLRCGAIDFANQDCSTPLMHLIAAGQVKTAEFILKTRHSSPNRMCNDGSTPFLIAADLGFHSLCLLMLTVDLDFNFKNLQRSTPLHAATKRGFYDICCVLVAANVDTNCMDFQGNTPLHLALHQNPSSQNHVNICKLLIDNNARLDIRNIWGWTPLMLATRHGNIEAQSMLIAAGANINQTDLSGRNALFYAINFNQEDCARILLSFGIEINCTDLTGKSPLLLAISCMNEKFVSLLLEHNPDMTIVDVYGSNALMTAIEKDFRNLNLVKFAREAMKEDEYSKIESFIRNVHQGECANWWIKCVRSLTL